MSDIVNPMIVSMGDTCKAIAIWNEQDKYASGWQVGKLGCVSITVYAEHGQYSAVPWIRILLENGREIRVNAAYYCIHLESER